MVNNGTNTVSHLLKTRNIDNQNGFKSFLTQASSSQLCALKWSMQDHNDHKNIDVQIHKLKQLIELFADWSISYVNTQGDLYPHALDIIGCHCNLNHVDIKKLCNNDSIQKLATYFYAKQLNTFWFRLCNFPGYCVEALCKNYPLIATIHAIIKSSQLARAALIGLVSMVIVGVVAAYFGVLAALIPLFISLLSGAILPSLLLSVVCWWWFAKDDNPEIDITDDSTKQVNTWDDPYTLFNIEPVYERVENFFWNIFNQKQPEKYKFSAKDNTINQINTDSAANINADYHYKVQPKSCPVISCGIFANVTREAKRMNIENSLLHKNMIYVGNVSQHKA